MVMGFVPPSGGGVMSRARHGHRFFFNIFPKQPKERIPNIFLTFWIAEVRFFDLKL